HQYSGFGFDGNGFTVFHTDSDNTRHLTFRIFHQIKGIPFVQEGGTAFQVTLIQGVQQRVTGTVSGGTGTGSLSRVIRTLGLTTKRTLINTTFFGTGEWQTHMLQFEYRLRAYGTHVFD